MPKRPPDNPESSFRVSRRTFLKTVGVGAAATGLVAQGERPAEAAILGPDAVPLRLTINGATHTVTVEPRVTLLRALRNHLGLTGAKEVCERGACGGCTVLFDGEPVCACLMLAVESEGHEIGTIEGMAQGDHLHPLQQKFLEMAALQCGICTPGVLMASRALLEKNPDPTEEEVRFGLAGNLCRCTGYDKIVRAVLETAAEMRRAA
jgi:carbon-monoxide dehydrogenase small subunit